MSHSQFEKIPISAERKERMLNEQIDEISYAIDEMKERNGERWTVKQMESQKKKLEEQLKSLSDESRKDDLITFEELGVDSIMVDEAHNFKNLAIFSKMNNVSGISSSGAKKSTDMQLKCQYLSEINDGRGIVFATGTPISNTMCEMYVMQLYLQKAALEEMGIYHFDSWAANFGEVTTALELTVEGSGFRFKSRFNKFTNLPELMNIFREVADVQTADMCFCGCVVPFYYCDGRTDFQFRYEIYLLFKRDYQKMEEKWKNSYYCRTPIILVDGLS